jgi:hypothetical protein
MAFCAGVLNLGDTGRMEKGCGSLCHLKLIIEVKITLAEVGITILVFVVLFRKILKLNNNLSIFMREPAFVGLGYMGCLLSSILSHVLISTTPHFRG